MRVKVVKLGKKTQENKFNKNAKKGESDRHIPTSKPKHLLAGKRGMGKTRSR